MKKLGKMKKVKLNEEYYHEAMDRSYMLMETINTHLVKHPVGKQNEKIQRIFIKAIMVLNKAYQLAGNEIVKLNKKK